MGREDWGSNTEADAGGWEAAHSDGDRGDRPSLAELEADEHDPLDGVETLRRAAVLMRERAAAASPGPWFLYDGEPWSGDEQVAVDFDAGRITDLEFDEDPHRPGSLFLGDVELAADAAQVASWHPIVAGAVSDLLESLARAIEQSGVAHHPEPLSITERGLAVARTYLGETQ